jgi:hypothetical protein
MGNSAATLVATASVVESDWNFHRDSITQLLWDGDGTLRKYQFCVTEGQTDRLFAVKAGYFTTRFKRWKLEKNSEEPEMAFIANEIL